MSPGTIGFAVFWAGAVILNVCRGDWAWAVFDAALLAYCGALLWKQARATGQGGAP